MKSFSEYRFTEAEKMHWMELPSDLQQTIHQADIPESSKIEKLDRFIYVYPLKGHLIRQQLEALMQDQRFISVDTGLFGKSLRVIFRGT